jgi:hypothetical protein
MLLAASDERLLLEFENRADSATPIKAAPATWMTVVTTSATIMKMMSSLGLKPRSVEP